MLSQLFRSKRSSYRSFSINLSKGIREEFGQGTAHDDDFLPDREKLEIEHQVKQEASISLSARPDDLLRHNTDFNGILYKYDLPVENAPIVFKSGGLVVAEE